MNVRNIAMGMMILLPACVSGPGGTSASRHDKRVAASGLGRHKADNKMAQKEVLPYPRKPD